MKHLLSTNLWYIPELSALYKEEKKKKKKRLGQYNSNNKLIHTHTHTHAHAHTPTPHSKSNDMIHRERLTMRVRASRHLLRMKTFKVFQRERESVL